MNAAAICGRCSSSEQLRRIHKTFEFQRISRWIVQKHCRLFANLALKANPWGNKKLLIRFLKMVCQFLPLGHRQYDAEVPGRNRVSIYRVGVSYGRELVNEVQRDLMAKEIQINPSGRSSAFATAQQIAIERIGHLEVENRNGQMEWRSPVMQPASQFL